MKLIKKPKFIAALIICISFFLPYVVTTTEESYEVSNGDRQIEFIRWSASGYQLLVSGGSWSDELSPISNEVFDSRTERYYDYDPKSKEFGEDNNYGYGYVLPGSIFPKWFESEQRLGFIDKVSFLIFVFSSLLIFAMYKDFKGESHFLSEQNIKYLKYGLLSISSFLFCRYIFEIGVDFKSSGSVGMGLWLTLISSIFILFDEAINEKIFQFRK